MSLCLTCGLCCDGAMFQVVAVTADEATRLEGRVALSADRAHLLQGCRALDGCRCGVYAERPAACGAFRCVFLASLEEGKLGEEEAQDAIREVLARRSRVAQHLGVSDERHALELARAQVAAGTAPPEVSTALRRLTQALLFMQLQPEDSFLKDIQKEP